MRVALAPIDIGSPSIWCIVLLAGCAQTASQPPDAPPDSPLARHASVSPVPSNDRSSNADLRRQQAVEELVERLAPSLSRSAVGLPVEVDGDGRVRVRLQGRFSHATLARRTADGDLVLECVDNADSARAFLSQEVGP